MLLPLLAWYDDWRRQRTIRERADPTWLKIHKYRRDGRVHIEPISSIQAYDARRGAGDDMMCKEKSHQSRMHIDTERRKKRRRC